MPMRRRRWIVSTRPPVIRPVCESIASRAPVPLYRLAIRFLRPSSTTSPRSASALTSASRILALSNPLAIIDRGENARGIQRGLRVHGEVQCVDQDPGGVVVDSWRIARWPAPASAVFQDDDRFRLRGQPLSGAGVHHQPLLEAGGVGDRHPIAPSPCLRPHSDVVDRTAALQRHFPRGPPRPANWNVPVLRLPRSASTTVFEPAGVPNLGRDSFVTPVRPLAPGDQVASVRIEPHRAQYSSSSRRALRAMCRNAPSRRPVRPPEHSSRRPARMPAECCRRHSHDK